LKPRVCAVSYLNTTPLVWGMLNGPQQGALDLIFEVPSRCAELLRSGAVDIGLVPAIELERQTLDVIPGLGIASRGEVRSILLISKVVPEQIKTLSADSSSRTSVVLARILLAERYGSNPVVTEATPEVGQMLQGSDACLVIGDPALRVDREDRSFHIFDLGAEWTAWTGLPMVYAVWAARSKFNWCPASEVLRASREYGRRCIPQIAAAEHARRGISEALARDYLTRNIHFDLGPEYQAGLARYRDLARSHGLI
jgi:chorismate dehydratase